MREIIPRTLWLGNAADARNVEAVMQAGITALIDLAVEQPIPALPRSLVYCRFPIADGQQDSQVVLRTAIDLLVSLLRNRIPTLVCCGAGMSRSPAVVAAALSVVQGRSDDDCLLQIVQGHPHDVSPQLWQSIRCICAEIKQGDRSRPTPSL